MEEIKKGKLGIWRFVATVDLFGKSDAAIIRALFLLLLQVLS